MKEGGETLGIKGQTGIKQGHEEGMGGYICKLIKTEYI